MYIPKSLSSSFQIVENRAQFFEEITKSKDILRLSHLYRYNYDCKKGPTHSEDLPT
jgi:hypothetical protein